MINLKQESLGLVLTLVALIGVPIGVLVMEDVFTAAPADARVITLTAVAAGGIWTEEDVAGHDYWRHTPRPARLVVRAGEQLLLRLKSADVTHGFAIPELDVGPVAVEPGHVSEVRFVPELPGEYLIQCSTRCGECHEEMLASIVVLGEGKTLADYPGEPIPPRKKCPHHGETP